MSELTGLAAELDALLAENTSDDPAVVAAARALLRGMVRCPVEACPLPVGHDGIHRRDWRLSPMCRCGHRRMEHLPGGRCHEGQKRCRCPQFEED